MRTTTATRFVLLSLTVLALGACKPAERKPVAALEQITPAEPGETPAMEMDATEAASAEAAARSTPGAVPEVMCWEEVGKAAAQQLVDQCIKVSPATHPPCNARNTCDMIKAEIKRSCDMFPDDPEMQKACKPV